MSHPIIKGLFADLRSDLESRSLRSLFSDGRPVLVYGAGNVGKDVCRILTARGVDILGFLDHRAGTVAAWNGHPIWLPDHSAFGTFKPEDVHVIIGIFNREVEIPPLLTMLHGLRYGRVTTFLELHDHFASELGDRFWLTSRSYYLGLERQIESGYELWADQTSRDLYATILEFRLTMNYAALPVPDLTNQYFPPNVPPWRTPLRMVDCGAFDGDTLRQLDAIHAPVEAYMGFEPDPANFVKLAQQVRTTIFVLPDTVSLYPCGVASTTSQVRFASGQGTGSHAAADGDSIIQCVSLDEALPNFRPNLIKMDIEGAEHAALRGARRLIAQYRPGLAICLYHRPEDLWQIPLLVRQLTGGGGKFYLRSHCFNGFELVLYWLPQ